MKHYLPGPHLWVGLFLLLMTLLIWMPLSGCQTTSHEALQQLAMEYGRELQILPGEPFTLASILPQGIQATNHLRVYLEGDGHAWATSTQPSLNPTPHNLLVAHLALNDPTPNVYLARPCQFVIAYACRPELWTNRRFSQEIITSLSQALDQLKRRYGNRTFELVGYSGGAALALLLAIQRNDVIRVQTIAGNLSPRLWTQVNGLSPLDGSLEPLDYRSRLRSIPQVHWSGMQDQIVPGYLADSYQQQLGSSCSQLIHVPDVNHVDGWDIVWKQRASVIVPAKPC